MKILVVGATGFIGRHLVSRLAGIKSVELLATARKFHPQASEKWGQQITFLPLDFSMAGEVQKLNGVIPDLVIHLAWAGLTDFLSPHHVAQNVFQQLSFFEELLKRGVPRLVVAGTCLEYGLKSGELSEEMASEPIIAYAQAKDLIRSGLERLQDDYSFDLRWLRIFYVYGEDQRETALIPQLKKALESGQSVFRMSRGDQLRDYLSIETLVDYMAKISIQSKVSGIINCCSGTPIPVRQLVEEYIRQFGSSIELACGAYQIPDYEPLHFWGSPKKRDLALETFQKEFKYESED